MQIFRCVFLVFSLFGVSVLSADLEDQLRIIKNKTDGHSIRNIDFIYMINLDQRPEKWKLSIDQLEPFGIKPFRFSAVNGWELSLETINDVGLKYLPEMQNFDLMGTYYPLDGNFEPHHEKISHYGRAYFCHCMARGTIGICLSHISILKDAFDSGYETIWVMEDDIEVIRDPRMLSDYVDKLDAVVGEGNWDILFTDRDIRGQRGEYVISYWAAKRPDFGSYLQKNNYEHRLDVSPEFRVIGARYGAHSMIIRRSGMKKLLTFFFAHQIFLPYDLEYILPPGIKLYTVREDVVSNLPKALSDNGGANYLKK